MKKIYLEETASHKSEDLQGNKTINNVLVFFIPDITIDCNPPYIKGKIDSKWISYNGVLDVTNKVECEKRIGMSLQQFNKEV